MTYRLQDVFTAIADPKRRQILDFLAAGEMSAGELADKFDITRPAAVKHLRVLEDCELIKITRNGRRREHSLNPKPLLAVKSWISKYDQFWDDKLDTLQTLVEDEARKRRS